MPRLASVLSTILLSSALCLPCAAGEPPQAPPQDQEPFYRLGISAFQGRKASPENGYLAYSIPLLIKERLESVPRHFFKPQERWEHQRAVIRLEQRRLADKLSALRQERDELLFKSLNPRAREEALKAGDLRIEEAIRRLNYLRTLAPAEIAFPEQKPLAIQTGKQAGQLLDFPAFSPLLLARSEQVHLLVYGSFEEVQEYLYFEIRALDSVQEKEVFFYSDAGPKERLYALLEEALAGLTSQVYGAERSSLLVKPQPEDSDLFLAGKFAGRGPSLFEYLAPGQVELRASHPGYRDEARTLNPEAGGRLELELPLQRLEPELVEVRTQPPEAGVYLGSQWKGLSPLELEKTGLRERLLLRLEGYENASVYLDAETPPSFDIRLIEAGVDREEVQKRKKDRFYTAFGWLALSLPLPFFFYSITADYALAVGEAQSAGSYEEASRLYRIGNGYYYAYWGSLAVSGSLFINVVVRLIDYIGSANRRAR